MDIMPQSPVEACFLILGAGIGVCYGFDGWTASKKDEKFAGATRLANLKYAVLGLFGVLITKFLKKYGITAETDRLFLFYLMGLFPAAVTTIALMTVYIARKYASLRWGHTGKFLPPGFDPVLTYLFFGFRRYTVEADAAWKVAKQTETDRSRTFDAGFLRKYEEQLSSAIAAVGSAQDVPASKEFVAKIILKCIQAVVTAYYPETDGLKVNANYMVAYPKDKRPDGLNDRLKFADADISIYGHFLVIEGYADAEDGDDIILPVIDENQTDWEDRVLPGAPRAFLKRTTDVISDTGQISFPPKIPDETKAKIKDFLQRKSFRSFASISILHGSDRLGVVNIESNRGYVFGNSEQDKVNVDNSLRPFCYLLGFVIKA